ncbi:SF1B family DNA helicase RecD2 [Thermodesulforhabdus norvegica]|uniref:Exodeoxyribonuclease V alpha subunit n=1 Tax=Thermodesulforhabdus norvegica TaxID=39841 RepID=A0A1I4QPP4_9BACT|nr:ATP-dependent RecD-like DNA helicase [Thermodesulforhabdus norvegica]SFM41686.1 exodeoxyribonuclease V alpha subunit [Thermodesulforhabdus norvegica]
MEVIRGEVERVTFVSDEDGYGVIRLRVPGVSDPVTATGYFFDVSPGEFLELTGQWAIHEKYGRQFKAKSYRSLLPSSLEAMRRYLGSGMIRGIGPVLADRIVAKFGEKTFDVMEKDPDRLREVDGIGPVRLECIKKAWDEQKDIRELMQFMQNHGLPGSYAHRIFRCYGKESLNVLKSDPYRVAIDVHGIGFISADKIAMALGIPPDSLIRAKGAILYMLHEVGSDGHVCYPEHLLLDVVSDKLGISRATLLLGLEELERANLVLRDNRSGGDNFVYLPGFHRCEVGAAQRLARIAAMPRPLPPIGPIIEYVQNKLPFALDDRQKEALSTALSSGVTLITGGPGTGKTTLVKALVEASRVLNERIVLAAPTGRAAKRLEESTGQRASTIHRLLEYSPRDGGFSRNERNPLKGDVFVIDETSMLDLVLLYHFLKAVPDGASLVFVGDADQLPSVGPGDVLRDLIESGVFRVIRLNTIYRQARKSAIIINSHRIREGKFPLKHDGRKDRLSDFYFIVREDPEDVIRTMIKLCAERIPARFGLDPIKDVQILTPMNRGPLGTYALNRILQDVFNPGSIQIERGGMRFRPGDKVMQIRNNYEKDVFNGDLGRIVKVDFEYQKVFVDFEGRVIEYDVTELDELSLAYAISIHKAQGSEYPAVIFPVVTHHYVLLQRNLVYTAVTRGKKLVVMIGTYRALALALKNTKLQKRYSLLRERLIEEREKVGERR